MVNDFQTSDYPTTMEQKQASGYRRCPLRGTANKCDGTDCAWYDRRNECCAIITLSRFK